MTDIYCGISAVPAKSRLGTMKECAAKKQIRYYGIKKIDPKVLGGEKKPKAITRDSAIIELSKFRGKLKNLQSKLKVAKKEEDKKKLAEDIEKTEKEIEKWSKKFKELDKKLSRNIAKPNKSKKSKKSNM